jgi:hypothetical protein
MTEATELGIAIFGRTEQPIIIFPNLFVAKKFKRDGVEVGKAKYGASFLFEEGSEELANLKAKAVAVARAKWGDDVDLKGLKFPFTKGTKLKKLADEKKKDGSFYEVVYSGCYVAGEVNFSAYNGDKDDDGEDTPGGVTAYLNTVVFVEAGTRIAGKDHAAAFRGIKGSASKVDPTAGGDDDDIDF